MRKIDLRDTFISPRECIRVTTESRKNYVAPSLVKHEGYELLYVEAGACTLQVEQKSYEIQRNDCAFISEHEHHCVHVKESCRFTFIGIHPGQIFNNRDLLERFFLPFINGIGGGVHCWTGKPLLVASARALATAARSSPPDMLATIEKLLRLMREFLRLKFQPQSRSIGNRLRVQPAMEMIYSNFDRPLSVRDIAQACSMSQSTFKRAFRSAIGKPVKTFLDEHRLQQSANLLLTTDRKVADVAVSTGFSSLTNFNRRFLTRFGVPPSQFRMNHSSEEK
jgi:AraC-like DNA-binding protein